MASRVKSMVPTGGKQKGKQKGGDFGPYVRGMVDVSEPANPVNLQGQSYSPLTLPIGPHTPTWSNPQQLGGKTEPKKTMKTETAKTTKTTNKPKTTKTTNKPKTSKTSNKPKTSKTSKTSNTSNKPKK